MDPEIQNGLENYLHGRNAKAQAKTQPRSLVGGSMPGNNFTQRLTASDAATQREVAEFEQTARFLHSLQVPDDLVDEMQPMAGFYARVMERIEAQRAGNSFWSVFLNPQFSRRVLVASAALLVLLGVTLATTDDNSGLFGTAAPELVEAQPVPDNSFLPATEASFGGPADAAFVSHNESGHDQMLVQLATYTE